MGKILDSIIDSCLDSWKIPVAVIAALLIFLGFIVWHNIKVDNFLSEHSCTIISDKRVPFTTYIMSGNVLVPIINYVGPVTYDCDFGKHTVNYN